MREDVSAKRCSNSVCTVMKIRDSPLNISSSVSHFPSPPIIALSFSKRFILLCLTSPLLHDLLFRAVSCLCTVQSSVILRAVFERDHYRPFDEMLRSLAVAHGFLIKETLAWPRKEPPGHFSREKIQYLFEGKSQLLI